jgi:zinc protease
VKPELQVVLEERNMRTDNDPSSLLSEQLQAMLYLAHPYRKPIIGWRPEIVELNLAKAIDFYKRFYTPANAIVIVAGDVNAPEVKALADKYYAPLRNTAPAATRMRNPEPEPIAPRRVTLTDPRASTPYVQRYYLTPSYPKDQGREAEALDILAQALGDGATSRIYRELVVKRRVASYAGADYDGDNIDSGTLGIYAAPVPGGSMEKAEAALDDVMNDVAKNGITQDELDRARKQLVADTIYALDSQTRLANLFGEGLVAGRTVEDITNWTKTIEKVTVDDIKAVAAKYLKIERSATGVLLPKSEGQTVNN